MPTRSRKPFSTDERKAALWRAVIMNNTTLTRALKDVIGCSYSHLICVLNGERTPSEELRERLCTFVGVPADVFLGKPAGTSGGSARQRPTARE